MQTNDFVFPDFKQSIVNVSATLQQYLGRPTHHAVLPVLSQALRQHDYQNIVLLVMDAMGSRILQKNLPTKSFLRTHQVQELTSVFPSTTASATTSLMSGLTPAEHGWLGWTLDYNGTVVNLFRNQNHYSGLPLPDPEFAKHYLPYQFFYQNCPSGRTNYLLMPDNVGFKPEGDVYVEHHDWRDMQKKLTQICHTDGKKLVYAYYGEVDTTMHHTGTASRATKKLLRKIDHGVAKLVKNNPDTLFIITADHGQIDSTGFIEIFHDQDVMNCLAHPISLDTRGASFKLKPNMAPAFQQAMKKYANDFSLFPTKTLIDYGVFGDFDQHQHQQVLGDFIAIGTRTNHSLAFKSHKKYHHGDHSGLTPDEMYVPLIIAGQE